MFDENDMLKIHEESEEKSLKQSVDELIELVKQVQEQLKDLPTIQEQIETLSDALISEEYYNPRMK